mgnify:CR=1 FL=1
MKREEVRAIRKRTVKYLKKARIVLTPGEAENIEVEASHLGMGFNPLTLYAIADRLAQPQGAWQAFDRAGLRALLYRDPRRKTWY